MTELFSGIGAQRMAMVQGRIPHKVVAVSEIDPHAEKSYMAIFGDCPNMGDIAGIESIPRTDILVYSFPCQSISQVGKREGMARGSGTESSLVWEVGRILEKERSKGTLPEWLLMENVPALLSERNEQALLEWTDFLESLGYASRVGLLNAKDFGVPQNRQRAFMLSRLGGKVPMLPTGKGTGKVMGDVLEKKGTGAYAVPGRVRMDGRFDGIRSSDRCLKTGEVRGLKGFEIGRRVYSPDGLSPTLTASGPPKVEDGKGKARRLTPRECWRLQGFPDWAFDRARNASGSDAQLYRQAGNSIAVPILRRIFRTIDEADIESRGTEKRATKAAEKPKCKGRPPSVKSRKPGMGLEGRLIESRCRSWDNL